MVLPGLRKKNRVFASFFREKETVGFNGQAEKEEKRVIFRTGVWKGERGERKWKEHSRKIRLQKLTRSWSRLSLVSGSFRAYELLWADESFRFKRDGVWWYSGTMSFRNLTIVGKSLSMVA